MNIPFSQHYIKTPWASLEYLAYARTLAARNSRCLCVLIKEGVPWIKTKQSKVGQ